MSRAPESYPEQTVAQWVAANDAHVLPSLQVAEPIQWPAQPAQVDYEAQMALGRKMRAAAFRTLFRGLVYGLVSQRQLQNVAVSARFNGRFRG